MSVDRIAIISCGQSNGKGTEPYLERELQAYYGPDCLLIKTSVGGSSIRSWQRNVVNYEAAKEKCLAAIANGYTLKLGVFNQGETDASDIDESEAWGVLYGRFLNYFRADIGYPNLYWITTILGKHPRSEKASPFVGWETIQRAQIMSLYNRSNVDRVDLSIFGPYADGEPYCHYGKNSGGYPGIAKEILRVIKSRIPWSS